MCIVFYHLEISLFFFSQPEIMYPIVSKATLAPLVDCPKQKKRAERLASPGHEAGGILIVLVR